MELFPVHYYIGFLVMAFVLSLILTPLCKKAAFATGQVAIPKESRWHKKQTALMGGAAIFIATWAIWLPVAFHKGWGTFGQPLLPLILCATGIFILGLADDVFNMDPQHKLAAQIVIAAIFMVFGFRLDWFASKTANLFISMIWIVGITNAFNLLDNMDGLSAGVAFIGGVFLFLTHFLNPQMSPYSGQVLLMSAAYMGAVLGFLVYNFNPASIFMGDAGSLFIGFMLGSMTVAGSPPQARIGSSVQLLSVIAVPILILFIPILDTGFVSVMRKLFRRPVSQGGRDHSSHRMVAIGFSEKRAVLVLYAFSIVSGLIALGFNLFAFGTNLVVVVLWLLFIVFFWSYLGKVKVYQEKSLLSDGGNHVLTPVLIEITYRRRLFEVLLDFLLITVAYYAAYLLRFEGDPGADFYMFVTSLPIMIACQILSFYVFGVYRGVWETTGVRDLMNYVKAITVGTIAPMLILLFIYRFVSFSRAVFVIYWILLVILVSLSRLSFRLLDEGIGRGGRKGLPTLVYGAGIGGQMAVREIETNQDLGLALAGFLDDNPRIQKRRIKGYAVLGGQEDLEHIIRKYGIKMIIVSFREKGAEKRREIVGLCTKMGVEVDVRQMKLQIT